MFSVFSDNFPRVTLAYTPHWKAQATVRSKDSYLQSRMGGRIEES